MNTTEVGAFLLKVATVDNRKLSAEAVDSWTEILDERITVADAWQAAKDHFAGRPGEYLMPGHINDRVAMMRKARLAAMRTPEPPPELDGDPAREIPWQQAYRQAIGDGHDEQQADAIACRTVGVNRRPYAIAHRPVDALIEGAVKRPA